MSRLAEARLVDSLLEVDLLETPIVSVSSPRFIRHGRRLTVANAELTWKILNAKMALRKPPRSLTGFVEGLPTLGLN
ncbi:hypothetical protein MRB53_034575 [Persea americana]|uniref:Uncharacterized protein n=1 Tax=Persea americana TaxID=3435 RepID=A0ACC2K264_PERAE|nr:hypothetical protein MRB53_034575 [Persea americana]